MPWLEERCGTATQVKRSAVRRCLMVKPDAGRDLWDRSPENPSQERHCYLKFGLRDQQEVHAIIATLSDILIKKKLYGYNTQPKHTFKSASNHLSKIIGTRVHSPFRPDHRQLLEQRLPAILQAQVRHVRLAEARG